jgi:hypothetical protein
VCAFHFDVYPQQCPCMRPTHAHTSKRWTPPSDQSTWASMLEPLFATSVAYPNITRTWTALLPVNTPFIHPPVMRASAPNVITRNVWIS